jgi:hypothetical protein
VWALALANNEPSRLVRSDELLPRLAKWAGYANTLAAPLTIPFILLGLAAFIIRLRNQPRQRATCTDLLLVLYIIVYALLHWLVALNIYDRYLLPLLPPLMLVFARGLEWIVEYLKQKLEGAQEIEHCFFNPFSGLVFSGSQMVMTSDRQYRTMRLRRGYSFLVPLLLCFFTLCFFASWQAAEGQTTVGGDRGEHTGIDQLAVYLDSKPLGTIIYDHWLGWELGYYLGAWSNKRRVYYPDPDALAADARLQRDPAPRYLSAPEGQPISPWLEALRAAGFRVSLVYHENNFVVYQLIPPAGG